MTKDKQTELNWDNLPEETKEDLKEIVIARIKSMPDNFRMCLGGLG
jgi:hypothetical protein